MKDASARSPAGVGPERTSSRVRAPVTRTLQRGQSDASNPAGTSLGVPDQTVYSPESSIRPTPSSRPPAPWRRTPALAVSGAEASATSATRAASSSQIANASPSRRSNRSSSSGEVSRGIAARRAPSSTSSGRTTRTASFRRGESLAAAPAVMAAFPGSLAGPSDRPRAGTSDGRRRPSRVRPCDRRERGRGPSRDARGCSRRAAGRTRPAALAAGSHAAAPPPGWR